MSKELTPAQAVKKSIVQMEPEFAKALPGHIDPKKFVRVIQTAITTNPKLMECNRMSLLAACTKAAEIGLFPNGTEAALVPYADKVQFMSMIAGKLKLARNSGEIKTMDSQIVYKNDEFDYYTDENGVHLKHRPNLFEERGEIIAAYAIGETKDGGVYVEVVTNDQIKAIESTSKGKNTPWKGPFRSEMIRKSVLNRLLKRMPTSSDIDMDAENDYNFSDLSTHAEEEAVVEKAVQKKEETKPARLTEMVEQQEKVEVPI